MFLDCICCRYLHHWLLYAFMLIDLCHMVENSLWPASVSFWECITHSSWPHCTLNKLDTLFNGMYVVSNPRARLMWTAELQSYILLLKKIWILMSCSCTNLELGNDRVVANHSVITEHVSVLLYGVQTEWECYFNNLRVSKSCRSNWTSCLTYLGYSCTVTRLLELTSLYAKVMGNSNDCLRSFLCLELWQWCQSNEDENEDTKLPLQAGNKV